VLPQGASFEWTELAFQERQTGDTAILIFALSMLLVFLVLAAQYESWSLPFAIILIVPMAVLSALAGVMLRGMDNNILTQIGLVVLVGLAAKNAILIVEFAKQYEEEHGTGPIPAVVEASRLRLRPILMTAFAFILGRRPTRDRDRPRRRDAPGARHRGVLRHARRDDFGPVPDAGVLRRDPHDRALAPARDGKARRGRSAGAAAGGVQGGELQLRGSPRRCRSSNTGGFDGIQSALTAVVEAEHRALQAPGRARAKRTRASRTCRRRSATPTAAAEASAGRRRSSDAVSAPGA
jgi:uncharacterized protein YcfJ